MSRLYLTEAEPFLPRDPQERMEESIQMNLKKGSSAVSEQDNAKQRRLTRRSTSLIISDAFIVVLEILQILALIQSMSLKWSWPETWIIYTNFIFIFNLDVWEFVKVQTKSYTQLQGEETPSSEMPFSYNYILMGWGISIFVIVGCFLVAYITLQRKQPPFLMVHLAKLELVAAFLVQVLALPLGTAVFRLYQCPGSDSVMAVYNDISCNKELYWAYFVPALLVIILLFGVIPAWMAYRIHSQRLAAGTDHHEEYMKLKEVEYMSGLDVVWAVHVFPLFSSFRLPVVYYRPIVHILKLVLLIIFSAGSAYFYNQAIALSVVLSTYAAAVPIFRPFRVMSFNVTLGISLGCLAGDAIFGAMLASVSPALVESPWLVEPYSYAVLIGINTILACMLIGWLIYMVSRKWCCRSCFPNDPLWPVLPEYEYEIKGKETYKFMAAVLRGRAVLDSCMKAPSVFAPVHHLARQIEIVNAYCREAELTGDGLHSTLLQLLDDMVDVHRRLEPVSLFADTVRENIRQNAARFVEMMPAFTQRLAQRDYDLILVNPVKKRLLLKMNIIGMFINGQHERPVKDVLTQGALYKLWEEIPDLIEPQEEREYGKDLYPSPLSGPETEMLYMSGSVLRPLQLMDLEESDEEESLATFLGKVPPALVMKEKDSRMGSLASLKTLEIDSKNEHQVICGPSEANMAEQAELTIKNTYPDTEALSQESLVDAQSEPSHDHGVMNPAFIPDSDSAQGLVLVGNPSDNAEIKDESTKRSETGQSEDCGEKSVDKSVDHDGETQANNETDATNAQSEGRKGGEGTEC